MKKILGLFLFGWLLGGATVNHSFGASQAKHLVIVGIDGLGSPGFVEAATPELDRLVSEGSFKSHARSVLASKSMPNWAAHLMGASPAQTGALDNDWQPLSPKLAPVAMDHSGMFPSLFSQLQAKEPQSRQAVFHHWKEFANLVPFSWMDEVSHQLTEGETMQAALQYFEKRRPRLTVIHLDHVDHAGHEHGYISQEYTAAVTRADELVGDLVRKIETLSLLDQTVIMVVSDHGGLGKSHGGASAVELEVPWVVKGPGIRKGHVIQQPVYVFDTASNAANILGLSQNGAWTGRVIPEIYVSSVDS